MSNASPEQQDLQNARRMASGFALLAAILLVALVVTCGEVEPAEPRTIIEHRVSQDCRDGLGELRAAAAFYGRTFDEAAVSYRDLQTLADYTGETLTEGLSSSIDVAFAGAADGFASGSEVIAHMNEVAAVCLGG